MKDILLQFDKKINVQETKKIVGYASENILAYDFEGNCLRASITDDADEPEITANLQRLLNKHIEISGEEEILFLSAGDPKSYCSQADMQDANLLETIGDGLITLKGEASLLLEWFDDMFLGFAKQMGCSERLYPVLLPVNVYRKTGYLKTSPQYAMFCCGLEENIRKISKIDTAVTNHDIKSSLKNPVTALSPAACFHVYGELENQTLSAPQSLTFRQSVFRNEGRFNWQRLGCLKSYHVREIVFIGQETDVMDKREYLLKCAIDFMKSLGICGTVTTAADPFIMPDIQKIKKLQIGEKSKYELKLFCVDNMPLACASFNLHGVSFSKSFNFSLKDADTTVSGCVGFGLERWVIAFLSQFGVKPGSWPAQLKKKL